MEQPIIEWAAPPKIDGMRFSHHCTLRSFNENAAGRVYSGSLSLKKSFNG